MCKIATKLPNYYKIYQNIPNGHICFYSKALQNLTPIRIFGFKIYHLATLVRNFFISPLRQLNIFFLSTYMPTLLRSTSSAPNRVTSLAEFSSLGRLFSFGSFFIYTYAPFFVLPFPRFRLCIDFDKKISWATLWMPFSFNIEEARMILMKVK
jgi:hypothetical protein